MTKRREIFLQGRELLARDIKPKTHVPVLLHEVIEGLQIEPGDVVVDGTLDGGGYGEAIVKRLGEQGTFLGIDLDPQLLSKGEERVRNAAHKNISLHFVNENFSKLSEILQTEGMSKADKVVLDLGFSSEQLESSGRGFSFLKDEPLLMTYNDSFEPVRDLLKKINEKDLEMILRTLSGERYARRIAEAICYREKKDPLRTSKDLADLVRGAVPRGYERGRIHPATRTFLALRIHANKELEHLETFLAHIPEVIKPGGRLAIITFQSLEDRLVKNSFRTLQKVGRAKLFTKKPITPSIREVEMNPRARSAKLRVMQLLES